MALAFRSMLLVAGIALLTALSGCMASSPPPDAFQPIGFSSLAPLRLGVGAINIIQPPASSQPANNVASLFAVPPSLIAEDWARQRLQAAGGTALARYTIKQASVEEVGLARTTGLRGLFTTDQAYRYDALLIVALEIFNAQGAREGFAEARVEQHQTVAENVSPAERERIWSLMSQRMARDLDTEMERNIRSSLMRFMR